MNAQSETLQPFHLVIGGHLVEGASTMPIINPATEEEIAQCPRASTQQLNDAVAAAKKAYPEWSARQVADRRAVIIAMAERIEANVDELARLLTAEVGKPLSDAAEEVQGMAGIFRALGAMDLPVKVIEDSPTRRVEAHRRPLGVIGMIIPWNFPLFILAFNLPPALLAGNTVVLKPAPTTPLATLRFVELVADLLPPGVVNVIADANDLGGALTGHPDVRKVSFTGSSETGKKVMASAAETLKRVTLELGGNDAAIVLEDADPKKVAPGIFQSAFWNSGQVCLAIKRVYAHEKVYDAICDELAEIANNTVVDDGMKQGAKLGPLQNKMQFEKVKGFLEDAHKDGKVIAGGKVIDRKGYFIEPTIVRDITDESRLVHDEQFGPVLPVVKYSDTEDAIRSANSTNFGLGASVWGTDPKRAHDVASRMDAGSVWINKHLDIAPNIPFGGAKNSGLGGGVFGEEGLAEYTQLQIINAAV